MAAKNRASALRRKIRQQDALLNRGLPPVTCLAKTEPTTPEQAQAERLAQALKRKREAKSAPPE